jgi:hypothetical protein
LTKTAITSFFSAAAGMVSLTATNSL